MSPWKVIPLLLLIIASSSAGEFLRIGADNQTPALQSAVTTYLHPSGARVTLVASVHVGEKSYYQAIAEEINSCDSVVYEGIIRKYPVLDLSDNWFTELGLVWQESILRYRSDHAIRGDLSAEEFDRLRQLSRTQFTPTSRAQFARQLVDDLADPVALRRLQETCVISQRNQVAIRSLGSRLARNDQTIALLYGAAHCEDLERRLIQELGFKRIEQSWLIVFKM